MQRLCLCACVWRGGAWDLRVSAAHLVTRLTHPLPLHLVPSLCSTKLEITSVTSTLYYFGTMAAASWCFFLLTGSIGFVSCLTFVNKIYSAIK